MYDECTGYKSHSNNNIYISTMFLFKRFKILMLSLGWYGQAKFHLVR